MVLTLLCYMVGVIGIVRIWQASIQLEVILKPLVQKKECLGLYISCKVITIGGLTLVIILMLLVWVAAKNLAG